MLEDELSALEKGRGYPVGSADRIRAKLKMKAPDIGKRIATIRENMERPHIVFSEPAAANFNPVSKNRQLGKKELK